MCFPFWSALLRNVTLYIWKCLFVFFNELPEKSKVWRNPRCLDQKYPELGLKNATYHGKKPAVAGRIKGPELVTRTGHFWCVSRSCAKFVASALILTSWPSDALVLKHSKTSIFLVQTCLNGDVGPPESCLITKQISSQKTSTLLLLKFLIGLCPAEFAISTFCM